MGAPRAVVVGSVNADLVVHTDRAPAAGETLHGRDFNIYPGGKGANQAVALGRLGAAVSLIGLTGRDNFASLLRDELYAAGVNCEGLGVSTEPTGVALITTERGGDNRIVIVAGANGRVKAEHVEAHRRVIEDAMVLLLQLELPMEAVECAAAIAHAAGVPVVLDPAPARPLSSDLLRHVDWLTPNRTEAEVLLGRTLALNREADALRAADALLALGTNGVLLKLGADGCVLATRGGSRIFHAAFMVEAVDTTAAGDAFNAGFASGLLRGLAPEAAAREASAVAALCITRAGAIPSLPTRAEVDVFLRTATLKANWP